MIPANYEDDMSYEECTDDLNRVCADIANAAEDTAIALAQIADNGILVETKKDYAKEMVTGFIRLNGHDCRCSLPTVPKYTELMLRQRLNLMLDLLLTDVQKQQISLISVMHSLSRF